MKRTQTSYVSPSLLAEAYRLNHDHDRIEATLRGILRELETAGTERAVSDALTNLVDYSSLYSLFTSDATAFWRRVFREAEACRVDDGTFQRLMLWAGVLEIERLKP